MTDTAQLSVKSAMDIARTLDIHTAGNGLQYTTYGGTQVSLPELAGLVEAVPRAVAAALARKVYAFVPLVLASDEADPEAGEVLIAMDDVEEQRDAAVCHRNATLSGQEYVFISTRLMQDRFALAFELYINIGHHFVDAAGVPDSFMGLVWQQAESGVRGETSQDAWEQRTRAIGQPDGGSTGESELSPRWRRPRGGQVRGAARRGGAESAAQRKTVDEKARMEYFAAAFSDAIAMYLLSLTVDFDYAELREREYPLLVAPALAERLRQVAKLFPPNAGQEFAIRYGRRDG